MSEKTDEQINKFIHEKVMGKCWHERELVMGTVPSEYRCAVIGCGDYYAGGKWRNADKPDYTSDASPRSLLNEAVATGNGRNRTIFANKIGAV